MNAQTTKEAFSPVGAAADAQRVLIALGSQGRGDDGVGLHVARILLDRVSDCRIVRGQDDCMAILNAWESVRLAIVVDASISGASAGSVQRLELDANPLPRDLARCSSHGTGLAEAVELGRILDRLPERLFIYAIEAENFGQNQELTPAVAAAARQVALCIQEDLANDVAVTFNPDTQDHA